jgi:membrane-associated phospholipid phosphatase
VDRPTGGDARYERRSVLLAGALLLVGIPFGLLVHQVVEDGPLTSLDERSARWLHERVADHDVVVPLMRAVTWLGSSAFLVVVMGIAALWLLRRGQRRLALFVVVVALGGGAVSSLVKLAVGRPRPVLDEPLATAFGKSFPSGHSMSSLVCFGALLVVFLPFVARRWRRLAVVGTGLLVLAIGLSRLVLGVHYLSDVLGGYVLGGAWLAGSVALFETWREERGRAPTAPLTEGIEPEVAAEVPAARP